MEVIKEIQRVQEIGDLFKKFPAALPCHRAGRNPGPSKCERCEIN
jgi:hypothetical protein